MSRIRPLIPTVSVVVPCRNERTFIGPCLDSILETTFPRDQLEIIIVDGQSSDGTREVLRDYCERFSCVTVLDNPRRLTPVAMNLGIRHARGAVIVRMDAHALYPPNYIPVLVETLEKTGVDNVGGVWKTEAGAETPMAHAISRALTMRMAIGGASYRLGVQSPTLVDTVPFGCYRRDVFDRIGLFDESLVRNQDDEFNYRLRKAGGKILLLPNVYSQYFARPHLGQIARMFYQYGAFKPLVIKKVGRVATLRQLVPALFVLGLAGTTALSPVSAVARYLAFAIFGTYATTIAVLGAAAVPRDGWRVGRLIPLAISTIHFAYGLGFLSGLAALGKRPIASPTDVPLSRG